MSETAVNGVEPIIFLDDVHVTFRTRTGSILHPNLVHAVQGVTIKLMPGQTIGIVGESGCGKSTTANVMCGLQAPTSGKVYFKGKDVTKRTAEDRRHMGRVISVVFQNPATALNPRMVVREQLLDPMRVHNLGTEAEQAIAHPVDEGTVVEEQVHRRQETHEGCEQPQEAKALLHTVPGTEPHCQDRQDHEQDQEHEALHDLHRVRDTRDTEPRRQHQQVDAKQHCDTNPR